jgi:hypothetical protein
MSPIEFSGDDLLIDGVPGKQFVTALKAAGIPDESVTTLLGQLIARVPPGRIVARPPDAAAAQFTFQTRIEPAAPECAADFSRSFFHPDFFDGLTPVQAAQSPDELGFNERFHAIETDLDAVATNLARLSNCLAELRSQVSSLEGELEAKLTEIDARLETKGKEKEGKDTKEGKEGKEKEQDKDGKDKEKEGKEGKEKDHKEKDKDHKEKDQVEKAVPKENETPIAPVLPGPGVTPPGPAGPHTAAPGEPPAAVARTFIRPEERPAVGEQALRAAGNG